MFSLFLTSFVFNNVFESANNIIKISIERIYFPDFNGYILKLIITYTKNTQTFRYLKPSLDNA